MNKPNTNMERWFHDRLYKESLDLRRKIMPLYQVAKEARKRFYGLVLDHVAEGMRILDYGCGTGELSFYLAKRGATVIGIDISEEAIRQARVKCLELNLGNAVDFLVADALRTGFPDKSFDMVCGISIIHHLDIEQAWRELTRILRPEGSAFFLEPLGHNPLINYFRRCTPQLRSPDEHPLLLQDINLASSYFETVVTPKSSDFAMVVPLRAS